MAEYLQLSDGRPDGVQLGKSATDKVAFFGATPVVLPASASQAAVTTSVTTTATTTNLASTVEDLVTLTNQIRSELVSLYLIKGSA